MIFAHRGFVANNSPENSVSALKNAYQHNFEGVEFDLWFINHQFVIKHDQPSQEQIQNLPKLRDFWQFGNQLYYWLDFKNLNESNYVAAISQLRQEMILANINVEQIYFVPYITNYKLARKVLLEAKRLIGENLKIAAIYDDAKNYQQLVEFVKNKAIKYLSIDYSLIDRKLLKDLVNVNLMAWTIKNQSTFEDLQKIGVKNFASDICFN